MRHPQELEDPPLPEPSKFVHVDNEVMQILETFFKRNMGPSLEHYDSMEASRVASAVFKGLLEVEAPSSADEASEFLPVDHDDFEIMAKGWALALAAKTASKVQSASPSSKEKRKMKTEDAKKDPKEKEQEMQDVYIGRLDSSWWECVSSQPTHPLK